MELQVLSLKSVSLCVDVVERDEQICETCGHVHVSPIIKGKNKGKGCAVCGGTGKVVRSANVWYGRHEENCPAANCVLGYIQEEQP
mgnify:CR=1 FL=1